MLFMPTSKPFAMKRCRTVPAFLPEGLRLFRDRRAAQLARRRNLAALSLSLLSVEEIRRAEGVRPFAGSLPALSIVAVCNSTSGRQARR